MKSSTRIGKNIKKTSLKELLTFQNNEKIVNDNIYLTQNSTSNFYNKKKRIAYNNTF